MSSRAASLLSVARESPARVAVQDRPGWLSLFSQAAVIEDPVGSAAHRRQESQPSDPLGRFYDTFIGPNRVAMDTRLDVVHGQRAEVARDVIIHTQLSSGQSIDVHAYLLYELAEEQGQLRIARLAAYWELPQMSLQVLGGGLRGLWTMTQMSVRMLRIQGLSGTLGYMRGLTSGVFGHGRRVIEALACTLAHRKTQALRHLFTEQAQLEISTNASFGSQAARAEDSHSAGDVMSALLALVPAGSSFVVSSPRASGHTVAFRFAVSGSDGAPGPHGIGFAEFTPTALFRRNQAKIQRLRLFVCEDAGG